MKMICRLCLQDKLSALDIFAEEGRELGMARIIGKYFWFEPQTNDPISKYVCETCWKKVSDFHEFYQSVEEANRQNVFLNSSVAIKKEDDDHDLKLSEEFMDLEDENLMDMPPVHVEFVEGNHTIKGEEFPNASKDMEHTNMLSSKLLTDVFPDEFLMDEPINGDPSDLSEDEKADALDATKSLNEIDTKNNIDTEIVIVKELRKNLKSPFDENENHEGNCDDDIPLSRMRVRDANRQESRVNKTSKSIKSNKKVKKPKTAKKIPENDETNESFESNLDENETSGELGEGRINGITKSVDKKIHRRKSVDFKEKRQQIDNIIAQYVRLNCDICGFAQKTFSNLISHMKEDHQIEKGGYVMCCNKRFHKRHRLFEHVQTHINPDSYKCNECGKTFNDKPCLRNHILNKHQPEEAKIFECEHCSKRFIKAYILERHRLKHEERTHICELCQKGFSTVSLLKAHTKMVHNNYGTMCDICAKVIRGRAAFERHQLEHQGITLPKLQCDICFTWHKDKYGLRKHKSRHNQDGTLHICSFCGKSAPNRIALLKHQRDVHTSQRKFQCSVCDKAFKRAINLKEHMTLHTGEVLYSCPHCPRTFNSNANMHSHRKKMHPKEFEETRRLRHEMATKPQDATQQMLTPPTITIPTTTTTTSMLPTTLNTTTENKLISDIISPPQLTQNIFTDMQSMSLMTMPSSSAVIAPKSQSL